MRRIFVFTAVFLLTVVVFAQTPKPLAKASVKPPAIANALALKFWKAQSEFQSAQVAAEKANQAAQLKQVALQSVIEELKNECGVGYTIQADANNDLVCAAKPVTPKPSNK